MQTFRIENDVPIFGVQAASFPKGVQAAWNELHKLLPTTAGRHFYGVSHSSPNGGIVYKACVEEAFSGEAESLGCSRVILPKGEYRGETIRHFMQNLSKIGETFQCFLALDDYDKNGACIEQYLNESEVLCMIRRADAN